MRIFALETDTTKFRRKFIVKGEKELLCTHFHWILFVKSLIVPTVLFIGTIALYWFFADIFPDNLTLNIFLGISIGSFALTVINRFIHWRYSFIFLTSEKVVCVVFKSLFRHEINPTHLDNINSTEVASEYWGFFRCGSLIINMRERTKYSTKRIIYSHVPNATSVAGAIENAIVLVKHRPDGHQGISDQASQIRDIKQKVPNSITLPGRVSPSDTPPQSTPLPGENQRP